MVREDGREERWHLHGCQGALGRVRGLAGQRQELLHEVRGTLHRVQQGVERLPPFGLVAGAGHHLRLQVHGRERGAQGMCGIGNEGLLGRHGRGQALEQGI
jgi:hypothetical protein